MLAQACEKRGRKAGDDRKVEAVEEKYHIFRGIGEQSDHVIHQVRKCLKLSEDKTCTLCTTAITDASTPPLVGNDHLLLWVLIDEFVILVIVGWRSRQGESRRQLMVTTSNHVLVNMADFGDDHRNRKKCVGCERMS